MLGSPMGMGMAPKLHPEGWRGQEKFQRTNFTMPNNISSMKHALKSVPDPDDAGVPHGDGDGPQSSTQMSEGSGNISND